MRSEFDLVLNDKYGIIDGKQNGIVLIKSGAGGSYRGYKNKYLDLADRINDQTNVTVITAGNSSNKSLMEKDMPVLRKIIDDREMNDVWLGIFGVSDGAVQALYLQRDYPVFSQMVLVNPPLCINFHRVLDALKIIDVPITFVYGGKDPSSGLHLDLLKSKIEQMNKRDQIDIMVVDDADHQFRGKENVFLSLADLFS